MHIDIYSIKKIWVLKLNNLMTYLVSITTKFPVQCVCGSPKVLSLHTIQSPRWYVQRIRSQFTLIQYMIYIHIKIYLLFKIIIVWRIQNIYINVLLTCTEIVGNRTTIRSLPRSNMRWLCISWNSFFVIFGGSCRSCIFFFRKDCFRLFRILRPMKSFSSFKWM